MAQLLLALCGTESFVHTELVVTSSSNSQNGRRLATPNPFEINFFSATDEYRTSPDVPEVRSEGEWEVTTYNAAYFVQLGFAMLIPFGLELLVEMGPSRALKLVTFNLLAGSWLFSLFTMQTKAAHFGRALTFGRAGYVATGRGFQMDTLSVVVVYAAYAGTHIYYGVETGCLILLYGFVSKMPAAVLGLSVWPIWLVVLALTISPWWFNPGALTLPSVLQSFDEWCRWLDGAGDSSWPGQGAYACWHTERMKVLRASSLSIKMQMLGCSTIVRLLIVIGCTTALRASPSLRLRSPVVAVGLIIAATGWLALFSLAYQAAHVHGVAVIRCVSRLRIWPFLYVAALRVLLFLLYAVLLVPTAVGVQDDRSCICAEVTCCRCGTEYSSVRCPDVAAICDGDDNHVETRWCGLVGPSTIGQPQTLLLLVVSSICLLSLPIQAAGYLPEPQPPAAKAESQGVSHNLGSGACIAGLHAIYDFWRAQIDASIGSIIFASLFCLTLLPLSYLQSIALFNQNFGDVSRRVKRRTEFLEALLS